MTKLLTVAATIILVFSLTACGFFRGASEPEQTEPVFEQSTEPDIEENAEPIPLPPIRPHIMVVSEETNIQFWQTVMSGVSDAADKYDIILTFAGPESDAELRLEIPEGHDIPSAICLSSNGGKASAELLKFAEENKIPVVGFGKGVQEAPPGLVLSTATTDNYAAGVKAAEALVSNAIISEKIRNAKDSSPVTIAIIADDAENGPTSDRIQGFIDTASERVKAVNPSGVQVMGTAYESSASGAVHLVVTAGSNRAASSRILQETDGLIGVFCAGQKEAEELLAATANGADLNRTNGKYKDLVVVGFEAGSEQKNAVRKQYFYGAVAEDSYVIGYKAVELAYDALQGDKVPAVYDTGSWLYTYENMDYKEIATILYD